MRHHPSRRITPWVDRLLDLMATRLAMVGSLCGLLVFGWYSFGLVLEGETSVRDVQASLDGPAVRGNAVAITDIYRLQNVLAQGFSDEGLDAASQQDFVQALDILFVRVEHFRNSLDSYPSHPSGSRALTAMNAIIALSDAALADNFSDPGAFLEALDSETGVAISALTHYMNVRNSDHLSAADGALRALNHLTRFQLMLLVAMAAFTIGIMGLLRREVVNRRLKAVAEERALFLAYYDSLTGLPNRTQFTTDLTDFLAERALSDLGPSALIFIDLDDFKDFNDVYGYLAGDQLLRQMAESFQDLVTRETGLAARVSGDEFALLLPFRDNRDLARQLRQVSQLCQPRIQLDASLATTTCSIGVATSDQVARTMPASARNMRQSADFAQALAKTTPGRGQIVQFNDDLAARMRQKRIRLEALADALTDGDIEVWFQPKVSLQTGRLEGFEALARWRFEGTMVPPHEFVTLAEENGLISRLDIYMLRNSILHLAEWNRRTGRGDHVSVNFSAQHLFMTSVAREISEVLIVSGLPPHLLTVELTETVEISDWSLVGSRLQEIVDLGCRLSVDDFGSGYSSLGYLRNIPAQELKIDRSLVQDIGTSSQARSILTAVVEIADTLGFQTVAEGIETVDQAMIALDLGCDIGQGYYFSRPTPVQELPDPQVLAAKCAPLYDTAREA